ncbi:formate dehydrogenase accessory sulfurtransferase FdhD [Colwellia sp. MSW7]|uniref:Sulfur carrier protein FdhD n=1 Tax=Colwellia maritima TaxID=2912588 RepID=A0ABS9X3W9_9GAMM|nr:formate dehydrogenase accessory sulfurtransferase FdhD [Colwellia maritima]MCI2284932.1 formate dehydrogenase accessory sulfurtransferase FdhD [Colwellia maritima]
MNNTIVGPVKEQLGLVKQNVNVWQNNAVDRCADLIAQEVAVALVYNGISHAVMMVSPTALENFAIGFSLTEGIINRTDEIYAIDIIEQEKGIEIALTISSRRFIQLKGRRRSLTGRTGCGICGAESLEQVKVPLESVVSNFTIEHAAINQATVNLARHQPLQKLTGAVHGATWCDIDGNVIHVCEDVGRHNALDKLIGLLWSDHVLRQPGFLLISSRASYEIVQKAAKAGIAIIAAVSAPTTLAINIADETGITLIGFSRQNRHVVYSHAYRLKKEK